MRRSRRDRGATTVEWVVLVAVVLLLSTAVRTFQTRLGDTTRRGGDCIERLDGHCAGATQAAAPAPPVGSSALTWGTPGFSQGMTPAQRNDTLANQGVADPAANYWTPFWNGNGPNQYTGVPDTGSRNTFAVIHDYNSYTAGGSWLGYFDVITPLFGVTHADIGQAASTAGQAIHDWLLGPPPKPPGS